jgi:hypothetical protein
MVLDCDDVNVFIWIKNICAKVGKKREQSDL